MATDNDKIKSLDCYRCSKVATVYVPEVERVLCDDHFEVFAEAYDSIKTSAIIIEDYLVDAISENLVVKEASDLATGVAIPHRVPVTLITDHMGELMTGVEPATCKACGKPMQLHGQWETTKQTMQVEGAASEGALDPDFLKKFDEEGNCLDCRTSDGLSRGFHLVDAPMTRQGLIAHLNGHDSADVHDLDKLDAQPDPPAHANGQVHLQEILGSVMADINKERAEKMNFPIYVDGNIVYWNNKHRAKDSVTFPIGMSDFNPEKDEEGKAKPGTGMTFPSYNWLHSFLHHITGQFTAQNSCRTCQGLGHHPEMDTEDVRGHYDEQKIKAEELARKAEKSRKARIAHSGPGIRPHDHHTKKKHYAPRSNGSSGGGMPKAMRSSGGGKAFKVPSAEGFSSLRLPPIEKWWYDEMNRFHDITHTEYKNPSYMYRNPNPMYYSPGSHRNWGDSKPWRN